MNITRENLKKVKENIIKENIDKDILIKENKKIEEKVNDIAKSLIKIKSNKEVFYDE